MLKFALSLPAWSEDAKEVPDFLKLRSKLVKDDYNCCVLQNNLSLKLQEFLGYEKLASNLEQVRNRQEFLGYENLNWRAI
jgi:hypothetical protein